MSKILSNEELDKKLLENHIVPQTLINYENCVIPTGTKHVLERIKDIEIYEDDILVASFPRCGSHWLLEMVWCIRNNVDLEAANNTNFYNRCRFLEAGLVDPKICDNFDNYLDITKNFPRPRFLKTHLPFNLLPNEIQSFKKRPKIICISRNPKDCCVSYYNLNKLVFGFTGDFDLFWQLFLRKKVLWTPYLHNTLSYWNLRSEPNILFVKYEDLKADLPTVIKTVSEFLEVKLDEEQITKLTKHLSFEKSKKNKAFNIQGFIEKVKEKNQVKDNLDFVRKGVVGDWENYMNEDVAQLFDEEISKPLEEAGLKFFG